MDNTPHPCSHKAQATFKALYRMPSPSLHSASVNYHQHSGLLFCHPAIYFIEYPTYLTPDTYPGFRRFQIHEYGQNRTKSPNVLSIIWLWSFKLFRRSRYILNRGDALAFFLRMITQYRLTNHHTHVLYVYPAEAIIDNCKTA